MIFHTPGRGSRRSRVASLFSVPLKGGKGPLGG